MPRNFWIIHDSCETFMFWGNPTIVFWSVSSPPGELKNLNIPIGISMFSACGGQGTTRMLQNVIFASFCRISKNSAENYEIWLNLRKIMKFIVFLGFWGSKPLRWWFWARNSYGFVKGRGMKKINEFHDISWFSWFSYISIDFRDFQWIL